MASKNPSTPKSGGTQKSSLTKAERRALAPIIELLTVLCDKFKTNKPLSFYKRLVTGTSFGPEHRKGVIQEFSTFFDDHPDFKTDIRSIPKGARIIYAGKEEIRIDIGNFLAGMPDEDAAVIQQYLSIIYASITGDASVLASARPAAPIDVPNPFGLPADIMSGLSQIAEAEFGKGEKDSDTSIPDDQKMKQAIHNMIEHPQMSGLFSLFANKVESGQFTDQDLERMTKAQAKMQASLFKGNN
jgi:hypothetical protein